MLLICFLLHSDVLIAFQLDPYNLTLVGGWCPGVCAAGFIQGGGTGPFSRMFGYGVDNILGATVVSANGTIMEVGTEGWNFLMFYLV